MSPLASLVAYAIGVALLLLSSRTRNLLLGSVMVFAGCILILCPR